MIATLGKLLRPTVFAVLLVAPTWASAQAQRTATTLGVTPVFASKDASQTPVRVASAGSVLLLLEAAGDWCLVEYQDPALGRRTGYVETKNVRISGDSVPARVDVVPTPVPAGNQTSPPVRRAAPSHVYLDINYIGLTPQQDAQAYALATPMFQEVATFATAYPELPTVKFWDVGADFRFGSQSALGVGFRYTRLDYEYTVGLAAKIPHPQRFNAFGQDATATNSPLERRDRNLDILATYFVPTSDAFTLRLSGGPTYFKVSQQMVETIRYTQVYNLLGANVVDITNYTQREVEGTSWGFNVGADFAYFFSRYVGVGGTVRYNRANVSIDAEPLTGQPIDLKAGGTTFGGGLRLRF